MRKALALLLASLVVRRFGRAQEEPLELTPLPPERGRPAGGAD